MLKPAMRLALVLVACALGHGAYASPIGYSVRSGVDGLLYSIDLATGTATPIGAVGFEDVDGLSFQPGTGVLFGVDDDSNLLITIDLATGAGTVVGSLGVSITDFGLTFDASGNLWMSTDIPQTFYSVDPLTGAATAIGSQGQQVTGLAALGGTIYGLGGDETNNLVTINTATGAATSVGPLGIPVADGGIDFDGSGILWGIEDSGNIFTINTATGAASLTASTLLGFEGLAIPVDAAVPEPGTLSLLGIGLAGLGFARRRRTG